MKMWLSWECGLTSGYDSYTPPIEISHDYTRVKQMKIFNIILIIAKTLYEKDQNIDQYIYNVNKLVVCCTNS